MNRELAIECIKTQRQFVDNETREAFDLAIYLLEKQSALDEWCTDCKEYDKEKHCCPRWNRVIREALKDAQPEIIYCKDCKHNPKESWFGCPMSHLSEEQRPETAWCWKGERKDDGGKNDIRSL